MIVNQRKNVVFAGCVRDCESFLPAIEKNLLAISKLFSRIGLVIFENDSSDDTVWLLHDLLTSAVDRSIFSIRGLDKTHTYRTQRLAFGRNAVAASIRRSPVFCDYDYVILLDFDEVNAAPLDIDCLEKTIREMDSDPSWGAAFANSRGPYYDLWALRHPDLCPDDIWLGCEIARLEQGLSDQDSFEQNFRSRLFCIPQEVEPFTVESAFGGLGIYKMACFTESVGVYCGDQVKVINFDGKPHLLHYQACEHVSFHAAIRSSTNLQLKIVPYLINYDAQSSPLGGSSVMTALNLGLYEAE